MSARQESLARSAVVGKGGTPASGGQGGGIPHAEFKERAARGETLFCAYAYFRSSTLGLMGWDYHHATFTAEADAVAWVTARIPGRYTSARVEKMCWHPRSEEAVYRWKRPRARKAVAR
ncbi:MAG: hypothetical protein VW405_02625 [Rhodospirillaceae bacterium]